MLMYHPTAVLSSLVCERVVRVPYLSFIRFVHYREACCTTDNIGKILFFLYLQYHRFG